MKNNEQKKSHPILDYINNYILVRIPRDEKDYIKNRLVKSEHTFFRSMLIVICLCQITMILFNIFSNLDSGFSLNDKLYLFTYLFLLVCCLVLIPVCEILYRKGKYKIYSTIVPIAVNLLFFWGCAITLLDSSKYNIELTTFSYVSLAITAFVVLKPWMIILNSLAYSILLGCLLAYVPTFNEHFHPGIVISLISIALLTCLAAVMNFKKRIESLRLQRENEQLAASLSESIVHDDLTKTYNRRFLTEHIDDALNIGSHPSGAIMLDIDDFKIINDTYGHQNGDIILRDVCSIILKEIYSIENAYAVRYGGEEFLLFIPYTTLEELNNFASNLRKEVEENDFVLKDGTPIKVTISLGCSIARTGINYSHLINDADNNLYEAKEEGKNKVVCK